MELFGILLSLFGLMFLAYKGWSVLFLAPLMAALAIIFQGDVPLLATYTQIFMPALSKYVMLYFPIFALGSIFGKLYSDSGFASDIGNFIAKKLGSQHALLSIVLACAILTYGGVSLFVVAFCIYPIALCLFKEANLPRRLIPGAIALGSFTFTMTAMPGTPAIQNAIPMPYFGTNTYAAPFLGVLGSVIMFVGGMLWMNYRLKKAVKLGEKFDPDSRYQMPVIKSESKILKALIPLFTVIGLNFILTHYLIPSWSTDYLADSKFGSTTIEKLSGIWALIISLVTGISVLAALSFNTVKKLTQSLNEGVMGSLLPIFNTATEVGYGTVIAFLPAFQNIKTSVVNLTPGQPLVSEAIAINILAGITGSASGGLSIALEALGKSYLEMGQKAGISPEVLHRVASMASGGLDTLPHNGAVITLLSICALTHKDSYKDIFVVAVLVPVIATASVIVFASL